MQVRCWGVRGSIPTPGPTTVKYGGNTACVEILRDGKEKVIIDSGSGIRPLGLSLAAEPAITVNLFISHTHWDHIQGFPFFVPMYIPGNTIIIRGPSTGIHGKSLQGLLNAQMDNLYFPVLVPELQSVTKYIELQVGDIGEIAGLSVQGQYLNHPVITMGYRFEENGKSFSYVSDNEPYFNIFEGSEFSDKELSGFIKEQNNRVIDFYRNSDLVIMDTAYTPEEYKTKKNWGHSPTDKAVAFACEAKVKHLVLFHHDPLHSDEFMEKMLEEALGFAKQYDWPIKISLATEGKILSTDE